jgi:hypothetical protein
MHPGCSAGKEDKASRLVQMLVVPVEEVMGSWQLLIRRFERASQRSRHCKKWNKARLPPTGAVSQVGREPMAF